MNSFVLDTHVLIWLLTNNPRLSAATSAAVQQAATTNHVYISAITPWEIAMLTAKKRLTLTCDVQTWLDDALRLPGFSLAPLDIQVAVDSTRLPGAIHGDPADRIIVATARQYHATLVTADDALLQYGQTGHVLVMDACATSFPS